MSTEEVQVQVKESGFAEKLAVVLLDFRQWTGASVLKEEDFRLGVGGELPPEQVIRDWGRKCICDPESLKIFATLKRRAERFLAAHGVPFMGGMAIPLEKSQNVLAKLAEMATDYNNARDAFLTDYDRQMTDWLAQNPAFAEQLAKALLSKDDVRRRIYAKFHVFKVSPLGELEGKTDFVEAEAGLGQTLMDEIAKEAQTLYFRSMAGRTNFMVRNLVTFRKWRERLSGLRFLDNRIQALVDEIDAFLYGMPATGRVEGEAFYKACVLTLALADSQRTELLTQTLNAQNTHSSHNDEAEIQSLSLPLEVEMKDVSVPVSEERITELQTLEAELEAFEAFEAMLGQKPEAEPTTSTVQTEPEVVASVAPVASISERASVGFW